MKQLVVILFFFIVTFISKAQNTRLYDYNSIGWYNTFATIKVKNKISIHAECQVRRVKFITNWQQLLLRSAINNQVNSKTQLRVGYGNIETFNYGKIPINNLGKNFTEHRIFTALTLNDNINKFVVSHRFMLEHRFVGRYNDSAQTKENSFIFLNRIRYLLRCQIALTKNENKTNNLFYIAAYNELFIGLGKNVNENVFDQNRLCGLFGYKLNNKTKFELGYLQQVSQLGREINNRNVFQDNQGLLFNLVFNI